MRFTSVLSLAFVFLLIGGDQRTIAQSRKQNSEISESAPLSEAILASLKARSIGPATMGGRVSAIALDPSDRYTYYVGLGTGGIMKTANNGATFDAIFEKEEVAAIGAIAIAPSNSNHVWVGTGEANDRNSSSWGNGVYLSTDRGGTWKNMGLQNSKTIPRIAVSPRDSSTVYVAVMGDLWNPGPGRGLFKTVDGGKNWKLVLSAPGALGERIGCGDVVLDPLHPDTLFAVLYARCRTPWSFTSGPDASDGQDAGGVFKSTDGGTSWKKLQNGVPGRTARIGLDIFQKNSSIVYAVVQSDEGGTSSIDEIRSKRGGVFRSEDGGERWTRVNPVNPRPFYFSQIRVDPENDKRIYLLGYMLHVSDDGGKTFQEDFFKKVHSDCHALAIDPAYPKRIVLGTDGGVYQSFDSGKLWQFLPKFAAGEYYRIALDMSVPYRIAGGLQDNLNWVGPSMTRSKEGILNSDWINIGGGDGFYCVFDPFDSTVVFAESQEGVVHRYNMRTGETKGLRPEPSEGQPKYRFHWNSPLIASSHEKGTMYLGGNHVFRFTDRGEQWSRISPDLSARDPLKIMTVGSGAENFGVVYTLAESPVSAGMLWAGTDDGKLWRTRDGGKTWTDLSDRIPKAAKGMWIGRIEPGHFEADAAYMAIVSYPYGVYQPLLYRTDDGGETWTSVAGNLPANGPVKVVREDPSNPRLIFAGTEFGLYVSIDQGSSWTKFGGLPTVSVDDIQIHPREKDLVVATHGRSLYIIDDIQCLEGLTREVLAKAVHLFPLRPARGFYPNDGWEDSAGGAVFRGANPPVGAPITFNVKQLTPDDVKISIANAAGRTVANLSAPGKPGVGRVIWDLKPTKDLLTDYGGEGQKFMSSGEYTVTLTYGKSKETQKVSVQIAPGIETR
jgi:photosystem II stability/assembly factor-like uncharacterized protein